METNRYTLVNWIVEKNDARNWSQRRLASEAGLSHTQVSNVINGSRAVTFDFCAAVAKAFGEPPEKVLRIAGLLPPLPVGDDPAKTQLEDLIDRMTPAQRLELLQYGEYLQHREQEAKARARSVPPELTGNE